MPERNRRSYGRAVCGGESGAAGGGRQPPSEAKRPCLQPPSDGVGQTRRANLADEEPVCCPNGHMRTRGLFLAA